MSARLSFRSVSVRSTVDADAVVMFVAIQPATPFRVRAVPEAPVASAVLTTSAYSMSRASSFVTFIVW